MRTKDWFLIVAPLLPTAPSGGNRSNADDEFCLFWDVTMTCIVSHWEWMCAGPAVGAAIWSRQVWSVTKRLCMTYRSQRQRTPTSLSPSPPLSVSAPPLGLNSHKDIEIQPQEMGAIKQKKLPQSCRVKCEPWCGQSKRNSRVHQISTWPSEEKITKLSAIRHPWWV